jgi:glucosamine 6-phosphate synthetase-like amidotransferase/phosphosugar isomerase protein
MCGLVGIAGDLKYPNELMMKRLLILDYFRGTDSTGLAAIRTTGETVLAKAAVNPITFFDMKSFDKALDAWKSRAFIGHNRAATLGKVNDANAHPYQYGDITGAHNGTLDKASWERLEQEAGVTTDTDSAAIFACINEIGIDDTIRLMEKGRTYSTGAWALTWYDKTKNTMNFIRNEHRPLWYGFSSKRDLLLWSSEWQMIDSATAMAKDSDWDGWNYSDDGFTFFPFEEDWLYSINVADLKSGITKSDLKKFKVRKIEGRKPAPLVKATPSATRGGDVAPWKKNETSTQPGGNQNSGKSYDALNDDISDFVGKRNQRITTEERKADLPLNGYITEERFHELARYGCSYCAADIDINDTGYTIYDQEDCILCADCSKHDSDNVKLYLPVTN